ncbi:ricin-type beta-trefoil lectin domain protein [Rhodococcus ruber]|uniref:Ricin-type beta-trefoil lectin domain protein n=1 Tax=Rhodococcus ruber TaxID=1830 RepID=A0ABT4M9X9_9NOCA|nr:ricin-type beta-trefoil lectin domain protein [Rhodococcus ruber]MCZ4517768.1 ricin-type beta-trefoil lectin domain protein [Rhodococcus ruber]
MIVASVSLLTVASLITGCSPFGSEDPAKTPSASFTGQIETTEGLCLQADSSDANGETPVRLTSCNGTNTQLWVAETDGTVRMQSRCLGPRSGSLDDGADVVLGRCTDEASQNWTAGDSGSIEVAGTTWCMALRANSGVDESDVRLATCDGSDAQTWVPVVPAPSAADNPGGVAAPQGDLPGWKQIFVDEFTKPSAPGSWANDCDPSEIVYTGNEGQQWRTYPTCFPDTYDKRPYRPDAVLSTDNGALEYHLRQVDGMPAGASISPVIDVDSQYQTYGRYTARFKVDSPDLDEYYVAWLLWPQSEKWPEDGEFDFPEGSLAGNVGGFHHFAGEGSCANGCKLAATDVGARFTDWHTYTMEWSPGRIRYILDDTVVLDTTDFVPSTPMRWELQTETKGSGNSEGNLILDWASVYSWNG